MILEVLGSFKFSQQNVGRTDKALGIGAMRVVKYFCYEQPFLKRMFQNLLSEVSRGPQPSVASRYL